MTRDYDRIFNTLKLPSRRPLKRIKPALNSSIRHPSAGAEKTNWLTKSTEDFAHVYLNRYIIERVIRYVNIPNKTANELLLAVPVELVPLTYLV